MDIKSIDFDNEKIAYLMRHGKYERETGNITTEGKIDIANSALNILKDINSLNYNGLINIFSSPKNRAEESAKTIETTYNKIIRIDGLRAKVSVDDRLDCYTYRLDEALLTKNYNIGLFVTHQPDIEYVTGETISTSDYILKVINKNSLLRNY